MSKYDDIINLPHKVSATRIPMPMENRAAQFAPFAALSGHDEAIMETARLTAEKPELSAEELQTLSRKLSYAYENHADVTITFFQPDNYKKGGSYRQLSGKVIKIDKIDNMITLNMKQSIPLDSILNIEGSIFNEF